MFIGLDILCLFLLVGFTLTGVQWYSWQQTIPNLGSVNPFPLSESITNSVPYSNTLTGIAINSSGTGEGTIVLTITSGVLPSGLFLGSVIYGADPNWSVILSGTPNDVPGTYNITIFADNGGQFTDTANLTFTLLENTECCPQVPGFPTWPRIRFRVNLAVLNSGHYPVGIQGIPELSRLLPYPITDASQITRTIDSFLASLLPGNEFIVHKDNYEFCAYGAKAQYLKNTYTHDPPLATDPLFIACTCPEGLTDCNQDCVDLNTDPNNCGECGNVCPDGYTCVDGVCVPVS